MTYDYSISCNSKEYKIAFLWAILMIFIYPIGVPIIYFLLLYNIRDEIQLVTKKLMNNHEINLNTLLDTQCSYFPLRIRYQLLTLNFLYESYQPYYWWWDILDTLQRITITGLLVLISSESTLQVMIGSLLILSYIYIIISCSPYNDVYIQRIKIISMWQIFFIFYLILIIFINYQYFNSSFYEVIFLFIIFFNIFYELMYFIFQYFYRNFVGFVFNNEDASDVYSGDDCEIDSSNQNNNNNCNNDNNNNNNSNSRQNSRNLLNQVRNERKISETEMNQLQNLQQQRRSTIESPFHTHSLQSPSSRSLSSSKIIIKTENNSFEELKSSEVL